MKNLGFANTMTEMMCMWICRMCMTSCASVSDKFSVLKADHGIV